MSGSISFTPDSIKYLSSSERTETKKTLKAFIKSDKVTPEQKTEIQKIFKDLESKGAESAEKSKKMNKVEKAFTSFSKGARNLSGLRVSSKSLLKLMQGAQEKLSASSEKEGEASASSTANLKGSALASSFSKVNSFLTPAQQSFKPVINEMKAVFSKGKEATSTATITKPLPTPPPQKKKVRFNPVVDYAASKSAAADRSANKAKPSLTRSPSRLPAPKSNPATLSESAKKKSAPPPIDRSKKTATAASSRSEDQKEIPLNEKNLSWPEYKKEYLQNLAAFYQENGLGELPSNAQINKQARTLWKSTQ